MTDFDSNGLGDFQITDPDGFLDSAGTREQGSSVDGGERTTQTPSPRWAIPGDDATDEDRHSFYSMLGKPDSADDYEIDLAEGFECDEQTNRHIRDTVHGLHLTKAQVKGLSPLVCDLVRGAILSYVQRMQGGGRGQIPRGSQKTQSGDIYARIAELQSIYMDNARDMSERKAADKQVQALFAKLTGEG